MSILDNIINSLNGKADKDLANCTKPYIVETYVNGTSGYNLYSNKYCEQWGIITATGKINLLKTYADTNYILYTDNSLAGGYTKATDSFNVTDKNYGVSTKPATINWKASGYIS